MCSIIIMLCSGCLHTATSQLVYTYPDVLFTIYRLNDMSARGYRVLACAVKVLYNMDPISAASTNQTSLETGKYCYYLTMCTHIPLIMACHHSYLVLSIAACVDVQ
jgi:hypothetical protein